MVSKLLLKGAGNYKHQGNQTPVVVVVSCTKLLYTTQAKLSGISLIVNYTAG